MGLGEHSLSSLQSVTVAQGNKRCACPGVLARAAATRRGTDGSCWIQGPCGLNNENGFKNSALGMDEYKEFDEGGLRRDQAGLAKT